MTTKNFVVTGMTCGHCEMSVREEVSEIAGVTNVDVSREDGHLTVTADGDIDTKAVLAAVDEAGFSAVEA